VSDTEPIEVGLRITAALDYARSSTDENIRPHCLWQLEKIAEAVTLDDLTTAELVSPAALLIPAHARLLTGRPGPVMLLSADYGSGILDQESTERAYLRNE
jgi:hypothetical protein